MFCCIYSELSVSVFWVYISQEKSSDILTHYPHSLVSPHYQSGSQVMVRSEPTYCFVHMADGGKAITLYMLCCVYWETHTYMHQKTIPLLPIYEHSIKLMTAHDYSGINSPLMHMMAITSLISLNPSDHLHLTSIMTHRS